MSADLFTALIAKAMLAPSVHNVQPARWRIKGDSIVLAEDMTRRLNVGDPSGHDAGISLGAAFEGLCLAANEQGYDVMADNTQALPDLKDPLRALAQFVLKPSTTNDPLAALVATRASWRGDFAPRHLSDNIDLVPVAGDDATIIASQVELNAVATQYDAASFRFMSETPFREELLSWMRLNKNHPSWARDGLNAQAMALSPFEAAAAGFMLGSAFAPLNKIGLAQKLLAEGGKIKKASAIVLLHRPADETPFESGRHFYRLWLRLEAAGFSGAVLAALADDLPTASALCARYGIGAERRLVSAFRVGRLGTNKPPPRARLGLENVLV